MGHRVEPVPHQMTKSAAHLIAHHRRTHRTRHDKTHPTVRTTAGIGVQMQNHTAPPGAPATAHRQSELVAVA